jgi:pimeloyl-ACP methyl ester carboxylesterase
MLPAMALMMDCSSGASAGRLRRLERERQDPANLLGDAINWTFPELCRACGSPNLGTEFRSNFECDVPTLLISGASDPRTPVANAEEVLAGFSHAAHFVASNVVHDSREWMSRDCSMAVWAFLEGELPESQEFELPPFAYGDPLEAE